MNLHFWGYKDAKWMKRKNNYVKRFLTSQKLTILGEKRFEPKLISA